MTNDITELAQSLKRRAASANEFGEGLFFIKADDVLALVEALEKAQTKAIEQGRTACELFDEVTVLRQRIADLESRTVKLPTERFCPAEYAGSQLWSETEVWNKAITACADELRAAGIKVEAE
ncbi:hypothetical protein [Klebsiella pneumoniae]|uniref:hypothetical protein n=1 Tax=Klebsiella pneumoniae TaxID=573 RepID=UPI00356273FC